MNHLARILQTKQEEVALLRPRATGLREEALQRNDYRGFRNALDQKPDGIGIIAEVKKASPSAGVIAPDFDPVRTARAYALGGANAISVLTDTQYFQGALADLRAVRNSVDLPVLRKDFIIDEAQIFEAVVNGADAILLIVAALDQAQLVDLLAVAVACQLDVLVEVHSMDELDRALDTDANLIGINNRNLTTFTTDLETTARLAEQIGNDILVVSESGLRAPEDVGRVHAAGADAILVGETLMRSADPVLALDELRNFPRIPVDSVDGGE